MPTFTPTNLGLVPYNSNFSRPTHPTDTGPAKHQSPQSGAPEGLSARKPKSNGNMAPRRKLKPDAETSEAIKRSRQTAANNAALAEATAEAAGVQALAEFHRSVAEAQAKSMKANGEAMKNL